MEEATIWLILCSIILLLLLLFLLSKSTLHRNLPPRPPCLPLIGHLHLLKEPIHRSFHSLTQKHGHMVFLQLGTRKALVISSPSAVQDCLAKNDITFANRPITLAGKHLNYNHKAMGFASYGHHWRSLRRLTTLELLSSNRLAMMSAIREDEVKLMVKQLFDECNNNNKGQKSMVETRPMLVELAFNIMLRMISGKRYYGKTAIAKEGKEFQILMKEFGELHGSGNLNDFFPILQWFDFKGIEKRMVKLGKKMDDFFQKLIDDHKDNDQKNMTLIDVMLNLQQREPEFYTPETVKGVIMVMLVAGSETTATTLEWALSLLLNNPETMNTLRVEIDTHVGHDHLLNESDSTKLKYLLNVITETLRLYPVAPLLLPHESSTDCKVCGYDIPKGTMLFVNLWTLHRDPNLWDDPTRFVPERFIEGTREGEVYNMIPFGAGRRACPGTGLAKRVMGHALGALIQCFEWDRIIENEEMDMTEGVGLVIPKLEPLIAFCKPRHEMIKVLSNI